jgi:hypothetical protein
MGIHYRRECAEDASQLAVCGDDVPASVTAPLRRSFATSEKFARCNDADACVAAKQCETYEAQCASFVILALQAYMDLPDATRHALPADVETNLRDGEVYCVVRSVRQMLDDAQ